VRAFPPPGHGPVFDIGGGNGVVARDHGAHNGMGMRMMQAVQWPEVARIESNRPMKFGGSCLLVARARAGGEKNFSQRPGQHQ
jgi:hypothetical protein